LAGDKVRADFGDEYAFFLRAFGATPITQIGVKCARLRQYSRTTRLHARRGFVEKDGSHLAIRFVVGF
jgi:hypothetical protein